MLFGLQVNAFQCYLAYSTEILLSKTNHSHLFNNRLKALIIFM